jgi:hypothetical protein
MVAPTRSSVDIIESFVIIRGLFQKGITIYGPFDTIGEAIAYGDKNFPNDTTEVARLYKEIDINV